MLCYASANQCSIWLPYEIKPVCLHYQHRGTRYDAQSYFTKHSLTVLNLLENLSVHLLAILFGNSQPNCCTRTIVHHQSVHNTRPSCVTISVASSTTSWRGLQTRSTHVCQRPQRIIIRQHRVMSRACCTNCQKWPSTKSWTWYGPCLLSRHLSTSCLPPCWSLLSVSRRRSSPDWRICLSAVAFFHQH